MKVQISSHDPMIAFAVVYVDLNNGDTPLYYFCSEDNPKLENQTLFPDVFPFVYIKPTYKGSKELEVSYEQLEKMLTFKHLQDIKVTILFGFYDRDQLDVPKSNLQDKEFSYKLLDKNELVSLAFKPGTNAVIGQKLTFSKRGKEVLLFSGDDFAFHLESISPIFILAALSHKISL
jgi:hypothetical protein